MKVIFNADDFGLTQGVNNGIVKSHQDGVVKSTTMMVGMDAEQHAIELAHQNPDLKLAYIYGLQQVLLSRSTQT